MLGTPIQKRKLSEDVRLRLLDLIERDDVRPGDVLPSEREMMEALGVGRPAIREAMQALESAGLIEIRHGERARVAQPSLGRMIDRVSEGMKHMLVHSPASLDHLKEARLTFELEMARLAAQRHAAADLVLLRETVAAQEAAMGDPVTFKRLDGAFHSQIAAISGNPIWPALSQALLRWLSDFYVDLVSVPGKEALTLSEHHAIIAAIESGSAEAAAEAMAHHLTRANALYRSAESDTA